MNGRHAIHVLRVLVVAGVAALSGTVQADSAVASQSTWARGTPKADPALTDPLIRRGKAVFDAHCRTCHGTASSPGSRGLFPGTYALELRYKGKLPAALEQRTDLSADRVAAVVRHGGGGFMPPLRPTELSNEELKAVAAYLSRRPSAP
jgi:mono/diheme cytochrome c family protein